MKNLFVLAIIALVSCLRASSMEQELRPGNNDMSEYEASFIGEVLKDERQKQEEDLYISDASDNVTVDELETYMFLCRYDGASRNKKSCCSRGGLALEFVCKKKRDNQADDNQAFIDDQTKMLWSAFAHFGPYPNSKSKFSFRYYYFTEAYRRIDGASLDDNGSIRNFDCFLHNRTGIRVTEKSPYKPGENKLSVVDALENALFCWKLNGSSQVDVRKISDILRVFGELGDVNGEGKRFTPAYSKMGCGGYNCATFCKAVIERLVNGYKCNTHAQLIGLGGGVATAGTIFLSTNWIKKGSKEGKVRYLKYGLRCIPVGLTVGGEIFVFKSPEAMISQTLSWARGSNTDDFWVVFQASSAVNAENLPRGGTERDYAFDLKTLNQLKENNQTPKLTGNAFFNE